MTSPLDPPDAQQPEPPAEQPAASQSTTEVPVGWPASRSWGPPVVANPPPPEPVEPAEPTEPIEPAEVDVEAPAWADLGSVTEAADEPDYDDWADEQDAYPSVPAEEDEDEGGHEGEPEPEAAAEEEAPPAVVPDTRSGRGLIVVLALVVAVLLGLTAYLAVATASSRGDGEGNRRAALDGARNAARLVFSYDYRHLSQDFAAGRAVTTGDFQAEYDKTTKRLVDDVAPRYKAVVAAAVSDAAVVTASGDRATVLVFVDQQSSSTLSSVPKLTQSRLEMTMVRRGGQWKVSKIRAF